MVDENGPIEGGIIRCYYPLKGFGFIRRKQGRDVFFYRTEATGEEILYDGAAVNFRVRLEARGPRAYEIERIG